MTKFLRDSFKNGNRYTNIGITIITILIAIVAFFAKDLYYDFKDIKQLLHKHDVKIEVMEANFHNHINTNKQ